MTGRRMVGIVGATSALPDTDMSTEANDMSQGYDITPGSDGGRQQLRGATDSASINVATPSDLQGPNGFNMARADEAAQNIVTNINTAGVKAESMSFGAADFPYNPNQQPNKTGRDEGHNAGDGSRGLNLDDSMAKSDY